MAITTLSGASSSDYTTLLGSELADTFALDNDKLHVEGLEGGDTVTAANTLVDVKVYGGAAADTVSFSGAIEKGFLSLQAGNDSLSVTKEFQGEVYAGKGVDELTFSKDVTNSVIKSDNGNDTITASADVINTIINSKTDDDTITVSGKLENSSVYGGKQSDTISVDDVTAAVVSGDKQRDKITLNGDLTNATISGGSDNDTITIAATVAKSTSSTVFGGEGNDTITNSSAVAVVIDGGDDADTITAQGAAKHTIFGGAGDDSIDVTTGGLDVVVDGGEGDDSIISGGGKDSITSGDGKDTIKAGAGNDTIKSGGGDDAITLQGGDDFATAGEGDDDITFGGTAKQTIYGGKGDDSFTYGAVADLTFEDLIAGDAGADVIELSTADGAIADEDFDSVTSVETLAITGAVAAATYTHVLGAKAQNAGIRTIDLSDATGNLQTVDASAYTAAVTITGADVDKDDSLVGGSGADTLNSGDSGSVKLKGNGGSDTFNITTDQASTVEDLSGSDVLKVASGSGNVTATVTADFTATAASTNNLSLAGVTLVATDNAKITLTSAGNNYGYTVTGQAANPDGNGSSVVGSAKGDAITGGANNGKDTFVGGAGDDVLTGNGGTDHLTGGTGDDTFAFTDDLDANDTIAGGVETGDKITVSAAGGAVVGTLDLDNVSGVLTVEASGGNATTLVISEITETTGQTLTISQTHASSVLKVNNDAASTSTVFDITGSAGADSMEGSKGADTITGGKGADTIAGGEGNDRIVLTEATAAADVVQIRAPGSSANIDTIIDFAVKTGTDVFAAGAAATFLNGATAAITDVTGTTTAGSANDNILVLDVDVADLQFDNAAALVADTNTIGNGIAGADATALVLYGSASAPAETRVAIAVVDNAGSFNSATDVAILKAVKSEAATFATNDFTLA